MKTLGVVLTFVLAPILFAQFPPDDLVVTLAPLTRPDSGTSSTLQATLRNRTSSAIEDVTVDFTLSEVHATLTAAPHPAWPQDQWSCTQVTSRHVRCRVDIAQGPDQFIPLMLTINPVNEGRYELTAQATWVRGDVVFRSVPDRATLLLERPIVVTSLADSGPGSLREAIERLNGECTRDAVPCAVTFNVAGAAHTIFLATPLPPITAPDFSIDGRRNLDTSFELDGSQLIEGHGLDLRGEGPAVVRDLSIGGFPWNGIQITRRQPETSTLPVWVYACRIGLRSDLTPNPNRSRGVTISAPATNVNVANSILSANARSGLFIEGAKNVTLSQNVLGDNTVLQNLGNGASGVFVGPGSRKVDVVNCIIAGNAHFGVAIARGAEGVRLVSTNRILGNGILAVDHGLDGFSGYGPDASRAPTPRITSARHDEATNRTIVEGTLAITEPAKQWLVTVFTPEAVWTDLPLIATLVGSDGHWSVSFEGRVPSGTTYAAYADGQSAISTSELSELATVR
ncbi:MAG TPA: right-handed parallel beta-helix repeat-containing protein [Thermoanaerobaculia bacterium]|nr:right-handed parallel beta-helix repeat-containing protein [Thermoanaerobaculia bacterium]